MPQIERAWEDLRPRLPDQVTIPKNRDCEEIMKQLITVCGEPGEKNFLGQYKSGIVNDTSKVKALYERNNLHLAEIAHLFVHNLKYEIPATKKGLDNSQKQINEYRKKEADHKKNATELQRQYDRSCTTQKIQGVKLREEFLNLADTELPQLFEEISKLVQTETMKTAIEFYKEWLTFLLGKTKGSNAESLVKINEDFKVLDYIQRNGNTSFVAMKKQLDPTFVGEEEDDKDGNGAASNAAAEFEIDWGEFDVASGTEPVEPVVTAPAIVDTSALPEISWDVSDGTDAICWDIAIEEEGDSKPSVFELSQQQPEGSIYKPKFALDDATTRKHFVWSLTEHRLSDFSEAKATSYININPMAQAPALVTRHNNESSIKNMSEAVNGVLTLIGGERLQYLLDIKHSKRLVQSLQVKLDKKFISERNADECAARCVELEREIQASYPKLVELKQYTIFLKKQLEVYLSEHFQGRPVHIQGDINKL